MNITNPYWEIQLDWVDNKMLSSLLHSPVLQILSRLLACLVAYCPTTSTNVIALYDLWVSAEKPMAILRSPAALAGVKPTRPSPRRKVWVIKWRG